MVDLTENVVLAAIEDDKLLLAEARYEWDDEEQQFGLPEIGPIEGQPRELPTPDNGIHQQGDIEGEQLLEKISIFAEGRAQVGAIGISTFGAVLSNAGAVRNAAPKGRQAAVEINFKSTLHRLLGNTRVPVYVENDASAAAMGEAIEGAGVGAADFAYLWVGRGVNIGMMLEERIYRSRLNPEAGHMPIRKHPNDPIESTCPVHGLTISSHVDGCITGFTSLLSLLSRARPGSLNIDKPTQIMVAAYLAQACVNTTLLLSPSKIVVGGMSVRGGGLLTGILPDIRAEFESLVRDYPRYLETMDLSQFIVPAVLGENAALIGMGEVVRRQLSLLKITA